MEVQAYVPEKKKQKTKMDQGIQGGEIKSTEKYEVVEMGRASLVAFPAFLQSR